MLHAALDKFLIEYIIHWQHLADIFIQGDLHLQLNTILNNWGLWALLRDPAMAIWCVY